MISFSNGNGSYTNGARFVHIKRRKTPKNLTDLTFLAALCGLTTTQDFYLGLHDDVFTEVHARFGPDEEKPTEEVIVMMNLFEVLAQNGIQTLQRENFNSYTIMAITIDILRASKEEIVKTLRRLYTFNFGTKITCVGCEGEGKIEGPDEWLRCQNCRGEGTLTYYDIYENGTVELGPDKDPVEDLQTYVRLFRDTYHKMPVIT